ncbi:MAG TPA: contractile injection system tape measure protein, partial [bacterium]|nr:contractile injection system tape measure protein [bacterium]
MQHIIRRLSFTIGLRKKEEARKIQNQLSAIMDNTLQNELDRICTEMSTPDEHIFIDHLELDLGVIPEERIEHDFMDRLIAEFYEMLSGEVQLTRTGRELFGEPGNVFLPPDGDSGTSQPASQGSATLQTVSSSLAALVSGEDSEIASRADRLALSESEYRYMLLLYFLQTGLFPWWARDEPEQILGERAVEIIEDLWRAVGSGIAAILRQQQVRRRLIYQFSDGVLKKLLTLINADAAENYQLLIEDLRRVYEEAEQVKLSSREVRFRIWDLVLTDIFDSQTGFSGPESIVLKVLRKISQMEKESLQEHLESLQHALQQLSQKSHTFKSPLPEMVQSWVNEEVESQDWISDLQQIYAFGNLRQISEAEIQATAVQIRTEFPELSDLRIHQSKEALRNMFTMINEQIGASLPGHLTELRKIVEEMETAGRQFRTKIPEMIRELQRSVSGSAQENKEKEGMAAHQAPGERAETQRERVNIPDVAVHILNGKDLVEEQILIRNAGAVLLYPFLNTFFTRVGIVADDEFV